MGFCVSVLRFICTSVKHPRSTVESARSVRLGRKRWSALLGLAALAGSIAMLVVTNPDSAAYQSHATESLTTYLSDQVCRQLPPNAELLLGNQCQSLVAVNQLALADMVARQTQRQNYGLFSIYQTTLALPGLPMLPAYRVQTIAVLGRFVPIQAGWL